MEAVQSQSAKQAAVKKRDSARFHPHIFASHNSRLVDLMEEDKVGRLRAFAIRTMITPAFDHCMGIIIMANLVIMIIELDQQSIKGRIDKGAWTEVFGWIALLVFVMELLFRVFAYQWMFFKDPWNLFDFIIVATDLIFSVIGLLVGNVFPMSVLRIFRLAKLVRVSKVLRVFPELRVLLAGLMGSFTAIFWGVLLLGFVLLTWSMVAVSFINPLARQIEFQGCDRCPEAYNSVMRAFLTLWQQVVAGDSWGEVCIPVIEKYPASILFFLPMFLSVSLAVLNLILGVVVQVALTAKEQIEDEDSTYRKLFKMEKQTHLLNLCHEMDVDRSGELSRDAVFSKFEEPGEFRDSVIAMDVTEEDFNIIWSVVDADRRGSVQYKELVQRLYAVRSSDTDFMLAYIKYYITLIRHDLLETLQKHHAESVLMQRRSHEMLREVEDEEKLILESERQQAQLAQGNLGSWQALHEKPQKICRLQDKDSSSFASLERSQKLGKVSAMQHGQNSCRVDLASSDGAWGRKIEALQVELKDVLFDMNQKLESRVVSLLNRAITRRPTDSELGTRAKSRADDVGVTDETVVVTSM